jgi:3-oxoadipate enol-lactonase
LPNFDQARLNTKPLIAATAKIGAKAHHVICFDTYGHGVSADRPPGFGTDRLRCHALALLDHIAIVRCDFVGLSLGGMVGQSLVMEAADRLHRLVLVNTSTYMPPREAWDVRINAVLSTGLQSIAPAILERWFATAFRASAPLPAAFEAGMVAGSPQGCAAACMVIRDMDFRDRIATIKHQTLVIGGLDDPATPPAYSELLTSSIAHSKSLWIDATHLSNVEQPEIFATAVADFLSSSVSSIDPDFKRSSLRRQPAAIMLITQLCGTPR